MLYSMYRPHTAYVIVLFLRPKHSCVNTHVHITYIYQSCNVYQHNIVHTTDWYIHISILLLYYLEGHYRMCKIFTLRIRLDIYIAKNILWQFGWIGRGKYELKNHWFSLCVCRIVCYVNFFMQHNCIVCTVTSQL